MAFPFEDGSGSGYVLFPGRASARWTMSAAFLFYLFIPAAMHLALSRGLDVNCDRSPSGELHCRVDERLPLTTKSTTVTATAVRAAALKQYGKHGQLNRWVELETAGGAVALTPHEAADSAISLPPLVDSLNRFLPSSATELSYTQPLKTARAVYFTGGILVPIGLFLLLLSRQRSAVRLSNDHQVEVWWELPIVGARELRAMPLDEVDSVVVTRGNRGRTWVALTKKSGGHFLVSMGSAGNAEAIGQLLKRPVG